MASKNVVIIGGGIAGLSIAHHLASNSDLKVTLLDSEEPGKSCANTQSASVMASGYVGAEICKSEGRLKSMCQESENMYGDWVKSIEEKAEEGSVGYEVDKPCFLPKDTKNEGMTLGKELTSKEAQEKEPQLSDKIETWDWVTKLPTIDAQRLLNSLRAACKKQGVTFKFGEEGTVTSLVTEGEVCKEVKLGNGQSISPATVVVANGCSINKLFNNGEAIVPVTPLVGRSLVLSCSDEQKGFMEKSTVLCWDAYVKPASDGRVLIGQFPLLSKGRIMEQDEIREKCERLVPNLKDMTVEESFQAARPSTPDTGPILGKMKEYKNVFVSGGYNSYGLVIAPKAAQVVGDLIIGNEMDDKDKAFLEDFKPDRVSSKGDELSIFIL